MQMFILSLHNIAASPPENMQAGSTVQCLGWLISSSPFLGSHWPRPSCQRDGPKHNVRTVYASKVATYLYLSRVPNTLSCVIDIRSIGHLGKLHF